FQKKRRDDRLLYLRTYTTLKVNGKLPKVDQTALDQLHRSLSYQDIRFYRALAEAKMRKMRSEIRRRKSELLSGGSSGSDQGAAAGTAGAGVSGWVGSWISGWVGGSGTAASGQTQANAESLNDAEDTKLSEKQVQELYDTIEFNEDLVDDAEYDLPKETIKLAATALLRSGSLKLKVDRKDRDHTLMGIFYDLLKVDLLQRPQNIVADVSMHRFEVVDGTLPGTQYPKMIYLNPDARELDSDSSGMHDVITAVADAPGGMAALLEHDSDNVQDPFMKVHFEKDPLDGHADSVLNMKVKSLHVVYHPTAAKAIMDFFEPPSSASAESMHALIAAASKSVAGLRDQTRAGLEYALAKHKTVDVKVDFDAPVFVIPQNVTDPHSQVVVLDTGYLTVESQLVDQVTMERIRQKESIVLSPEEMKELENLMYDHFDMQLHSTQLLVGNDLQACMRALTSGAADTKLHVVDKIELSFDLGLCILPEPPMHMPKVTLDGSLPSLQVFFSDRKYKAVMSTIDLIVEALNEDEPDLTGQYEAGSPHVQPTAFGAGGIFSRISEVPDRSDDPAMALQADSDDAKSDSDDAGSVDEFFETTDAITEGEAAGTLRRKKNREGRRKVGKEPERPLVRVTFSVDNLVGFIWRTHDDGRDDLHIADIAVTGFAVEVVNRPFDLSADVTIHQITVEDHLMLGGMAGSPHVYALTSDIAQADVNGETDKNLVVVKYHRCQGDHPEFTTTYESIGQTVDVEVSYLDLMVVRKTILTCYDFILKTFTDEKKNNERGQQLNNVDDGASEQSDKMVDSLLQQALDTIRVDVRLKGTDFSLCHDDGLPVALLSVTAAAVRVIVTEEVVVEAKVGNIMLVDQLDTVPAATGALGGHHQTHDDIDPNRLLLYVKGDELADFRYQTFDPHSAGFPGHNSAVKLRVGAAHLTFVERPIRELMLFGSRFSAMHGLFEAARQAAAYGTSQLTEEMIGTGQKVHFDVVMSAPVIVFPRDGFMPYAADGGQGLAVDMLVAQPGELSISNEFTTVREMDRDWDINRISLALRRIGITSMFSIDSAEHTQFGQAKRQELQILEDVDFGMDMHVLIDGHIPGCMRPVTELIGTLSPVKMRLTEFQYKVIYDLLGVIARVFGNDPNAPAAADPLINDKVLDLSILRDNPATSNAENAQKALENLGQAARTPDVDDALGSYATIDLYVTLSTIQLELFQGSGFHLDSIQRASFTRADINGLSVKYRAKANGDSKAEFAINAVRAYDTRPGTQNQFTQLISPTTEGRHGQQAEDGAHVASSMHAMARDGPVDEDTSSPQLICHIDMRPNQDMVLLLTLDSPRVVLVLDHVFILVGFVMSVFPQQAPEQQKQKPSGDMPSSDFESTGGLIYKVDVLHPEFILLADPTSRSSEALVLSISQIIVAQEGMFCTTIDEIGVSLCSIDRRKETARSVMDPFTVITTMDQRVTPGDIVKGVPTHSVTDISVDVGSLLLRVGINDAILMLDIFNHAMELMYKQAEEPADTDKHEMGSSLGRTDVQSQPVEGSVSGSSTRNASHDSTNPSARIIKETMRVTVASLRFVVIRDIFGLPVYGCTAKGFHVDLSDWSIAMRIKSDLQLQASYFNRRNSHWEPFIEPWRCALNMQQADGGSQKIDINSADRLHVNASHTFIEETLSLLYQWNDEMDKHAKQKETAKPTGERMPYVLINRTGIDCHVWVDLPEGANARTERIDTTPVLLRDGSSLPWRFEDWRRRREQLEVKSHHLGIQFANGQWEWLRRVQVDREGVKYYSLQPALDSILHRLAVEVSLDAANLVKRVTLRSPLVVENQTRVAMEVAMCDYRGEMRTDAAVIQPGEDLPLPLLFCHQYAVRARPEQGFGYAWSSQYIFWRDFLGQDARTELCCLPSTAEPTRTLTANDVYVGGRNAKIARSDVVPFFIHFNALCDARNPALYKYPFMRLVMTPPLEIENLLPYPINFIVVDKTANRRWVSSLEYGGTAAVHAVQPGHLVLLSIKIPEAGFDNCDGTIIESPDEDEYPVDNDVAMTDRDGLRLLLKLHRMDIPNSGGRCRRISIYAPYVMVNRTGLPLFFSSKSFFKGIMAVAGQNISGNRPQPASLASRLLPSTNDFTREQPPSSDSARPLMFSFGSYDLRNRALVRAGNTEWSKPLSFDAIGSASEFSIPATDGISDMHFGIEIDPGLGRYSHTRVVTFSSRYVVKNQSGLALQYRTVYNTDSSVRINDGERQPLHTMYKARRRLLTVACAPEDGGAAQVSDIAWSAPFSIDDIGRIFVRVPTAHGEILAKVDVVMEGACLFVILQKETRYWPFRIENNTEVDITVWQYRERVSSDQRPNDAVGRIPSPTGSPARDVSDGSEKRYKVMAGQTLEYAWDQPTAARKLLVVSALGKTRRISLQEIGEQTPFEFAKPALPPRRGASPATVANALAHTTMNIDVVASGPSQVLKLTGYTPDSHFMPQMSRVQSTSRLSRTPTAQTTSSESSVTKRNEERFEVVGGDEKTNFVFRLGLEGGIGVSLINKYASEILFATLSDVELKLTDSTSNQTARLTVKWVQIDNQIYGALYPIVLYPTTLGVATPGTATPPALQAVVVRAKDNSYGVEYFKYASVLAQELSVELDEDFLYALLDFVKFDTPGDTPSQGIARMLDSGIPEVSALDEGLQLYFEFLHIQPFKLNISFMRTQRLDIGGDPTARQAQSITSYNSRLAMTGSAEQAGEGVASTPGVVAYATNVLTMAIGNVNEAPVYLNALIMQNVRVSMAILSDRMYKHYSQEVFAQVYKVVGSANLLGNPVGLFNNISSGVSDFFYEPYQGFVMSDRPQDFGFGLARGTASLFKKTVFGMTDSFSKFTDSVSKGLSAATLDPQFQSARTLNRVRNKPKHAIYGVARGAESLAKGVGSGLAGVVMRPIEGAEQEGVGGFLKGVGKGLVGVVTKPMIGMFDLASNVTEGIRNTTTLFERDLDRLRLPRHIGKDGILAIYSEREALGQAWMRELRKGAYAYDSYLAHLELPGSDMVVLLTYQRLVMFRRAKPDDAGMAVGAAGSSIETGSATGAIGVSASNAAKAQVEWEQDIKSLHSIQLEAGGISLKLPALPDGQGAPPGPFIPIADAQSRRWFYDKIKEAVKALVDDRKELN
ncbi:Vacuolar protein sorting-associated protein 13, partial [Linderina pennispora]